MWWVQLLLLGFVKLRIGLVFKKYLLNLQQKTIVMPILNIRKGYKKEMKKQ
jgi:hypothetical protein